MFNILRMKKNGVKVINDKECHGVCDMCDKMIQKYFQVTFNDQQITVCKKKCCKEKLWKTDSRTRQVLK